IKFAASELKLNKIPEVNYENLDSQNSFGSYNLNSSETKIRKNNRHPNDVARTIAHEFSHHKEKELGINYHPVHSEDFATMLAGRIMRKYNNRFPDNFKEKAIMETESLVPANSMGDTP